ncbi:phage tail assembly protein [Neisseria sp. 23W00296]|uniref:phage tail assembly protein n=1 Tax=unclassified Neisseria TaxID=2623750 RepID=UPI0037583D44
MANEAQQMQEKLGTGKEIRLHCPLRLADGRLLESVTVRRAKVGDIRAVAHLEGDAAQEIAMMARLSGLVPEDLENMDLCDYKQMQEFFRTCQEPPRAV